LANEDLVVGLDIGTTKVCVAIAERNEKGILEITGVGVSPSAGMRKGVVVNIEANIKSIIEAIEAAEMMSGREVSACWTGILMLDVCRQLGKDAPDEIDVRSGIGVVNAKEVRFGK